jgi:hypothetical protein
MGAKFGLPGLLGLILLTAQLAPLFRETNSQPTELIASPAAPDYPALTEPAAPVADVGLSHTNLPSADGLGGSPDLLAAGSVLVLPDTALAVPTPEPSPALQPEEQQANGAPSPEQAGASTTEADASTDRTADEASLESPPRPLSGVRFDGPAPRRVSSEPPPAVTALHVAILDDASGEMLHGQGEHERVAPASLTKIATTLVALEREPELGRRTPVTISGSAMAARDRSTIMGLEPGRQVSLATMLYGMMLPSGNDAAEQVALLLASSRENYVAWMNQKVDELGLQDTHFQNPSGMDAAGQYSSAYDMASLGRAAMRNETFRQIAGAATYRGDGYSMANLNRLIGAYPGADGIKVGLTRAAGRTMVATASRDGHRVYVSLMRSRDLPGDSTSLLDWTWRAFEW